MYEEHKYLHSTMYAEHKHLHSIQAGTNYVYVHSLTSSASIVHDLHGANEDILTTKFPPVYGTKSPSTVNHRA